MLRREGYVILVQIYGLEDSCISTQTLKNVCLGARRESSRKMEGFAASPAKKHIPKNRSGTLPAISAFVSARRNT